jgi:hypothetical protein
VTRVADGSRPLFDRYVAVDWSAAAGRSTGADSVWIARLDRDDTVRLSNPPTRHQARAELSELLSSAGRTLLVIDVSLGYPAGSAQWFGLGGAPAWRAWWDTISAAMTDDERNRNNRFEVAAELNRRSGGPAAFWGCPASFESDHLVPTKPTSFPVPEFRHLEQGWRAAGRRPASSWQLVGVGAVGSQTLTAVPVLAELVSAGAEVWPFTTGLGVPESGSVVIAETWPTAFDLDLPAGMVRDAAQVDGVVRRLRSADRSGDLASWFTPSLPPEVRRVVETEEGWALVPVDR